ncbi:hypothetical protein GF358_03995 [Candidatus Woesearchaeota archaeon]|nr:hypothetical protein [Candidatus Woesearchaeota archaeon]
MYNIDFRDKIEKSRRHIFGAGCIDPRAASQEAYQAYSHPENAKILECHEDVNGEWVPVPSKLEKEIKK